MLERLDIHMRKNESIPNLTIYIHTRVCARTHTHTKKKLKMAYRPQCKIIKSLEDNIELVKEGYLKYTSESRSVMSDSLQPHGLYSPWILQARILEWG